MSKSTFSLLILLLTCGGILGSCSEQKGEEEKPPEPIKVKEIALAVEENDTTGREVESLKPTDNPFHAIIRLNKSGSGDTVRMEFVAIGADSGRDYTILTKEYTVGGINNQVDFNLSLPRPWPLGPYRIDAYLNDSLSMSREFEVRE